MKEIQKPSAIMVKAAERLYDCKVQVFHYTAFEALNDEVLKVTSNAFERFMVIHLVMHYFIMFMPTSIVIDPKRYQDWCMSRKQAVMSLMMAAAIAESEGF